MAQWLKCGKRRFVALLVATIAISATILFFLAELASSQYKLEQSIARELIQHGASVQWKLDVYRWQRSLGFTSDKDQRIDYISFVKSSAEDADLELIGKLSKLKHLSLYKSPISDEGISHLKDATALEYLQLTNTNIGDKGLESISGLRKLGFLYLNNTRITDRGMRSIAMLTTLPFLELKGTNITPTGVRELHTLKGLRHVKLDAKHVTPEVLRFLIQQLPECQFDIDGQKYGKIYTGLIWSGR